LANLGPELFQVLWRQTEAVNGFGFTQPLAQIAQSGKNGPVFIGETRKEKSGLQMYLKEMQMVPFNQKTINLKERSPGISPRGFNK
jgi:hypothetical protein